MKIAIKKSPCLLTKEQEERLGKIQERFPATEEQCRHDSCSKCLGMGVKANGDTCVHMISCHCQRCRSV